MPWYFCSDRNHRILGKRLSVALAVADSPFEPRHIMVDDMRAVPARAAGGVPVMDFKLHCLLHTCLQTPQKDQQQNAPQTTGGSFASNSLSEGGHFIWSDVDVQPTAPLRHLHAVLMNLVPEGNNDPRVDIWTQREFEDAGTNVGFMMLRESAATRRLLLAVRAEMARSRGLDQNVLNKMLLAGDTHGAVVRRLPATVWASSNAENAPPLDKLLLHHANFIVRPPGWNLCASTDPQPKLEQLERVSDLLGRQDSAGWHRMIAEITEDRGLASYKARHFNAETLTAWRRIANCAGEGSNET